MCPLLQSTGSPLLQSTGSPLLQSTPVRRPASQVAMASGTARWCVLAIQSTSQARRVKPHRAASPRCVQVVITIHP